MKRSYLYLLAALLLGGSTLMTSTPKEGAKEAAKASILEALKAERPSKGCQVYGEIEFVEHGADYEVEFVDYNGDLKVEYVDHGADEPGLWEQVDHGEDYEIEVVDHGGDFTVEEVDHGAGCD